MKCGHVMSPGTAFRIGHFAAIKIVPNFCDLLSAKFLINIIMEKSTSLLNESNHISDPTLSGLGQWKGFNTEIFDLGHGVNVLKGLDTSDTGSVTTWALFRSHVRSLLLVIAFYFYGWYIYVNHYTTKYLYSMRDIALVEWAASSWYSMHLIPYRVVSQLVRLECSGYATEDYEQVFPSDLSSCANYPHSIGLILQSNEFALVAPPEVPRPHLGPEVKIVVPSKKDVQQAISLQHEYSLKQRMHMAAEDVRMLSEVTRFVLWLTLLADINSEDGASIQFATIFERTGSLWKDDDAIKDLKDSIRVELRSFNSVCSKRKVHYPSVSLHNCVTGKCVSIFDDATETEITNEAPKDAAEFCEIGLVSATASPQTQSIKIYLSDNRLSKESVEALDKFPPLPDLLLVPRCAWRYKLFGLLPYLSSRDGLEETAVYSSGSRLSFKYFARSINFYRAHNEVKIANSAPSNISILSINSSNFARLFWRRVQHLRILDVNSAVEEGQ